MLRVLKEANYDDGLVGFYQATTMGAFLRQSFISSQILHQDALRQGGIALVHGEVLLFRSGRTNKLTGFVNSVRRVSSRSWGGVLKSLPIERFVLGCQQDEQVR